MGIQIVAPRQLKVLSVRSRMASGVTMIASASVPEEVGPPLAPKMTRGRLLTGGGIIMPEGDGCVVIFMTQIDFGGSLPAAIVVRASHVPTACRLCTVTLRAPPHPWRRPGASPRTVASPRVRLSLPCRGWFSVSSLIIMTLSPCILLEYFLRALSESIRICLRNRRTWWPSRNLWRSRRRATT